MPHVGNMKLGKGPAVRDMRIPLMKQYRTASPKPPPSVDYHKKLQDLGHKGQIPLWANDRYGDCTCVTPTSAIFHWTLLDEDKPFSVPEQKVLALYSATSGFDINNVRATDNGGIISQVLVYLATAGYDVGQSKNRCFVSGQVNRVDLDELKDCISIGGCLNWGVELPLSAQSTDGGWDVPRGGTGTERGAVGGWGGHDMLLVGYDEQHFYGLTWGMVVPITNRFILTYGSEGFWMVDDIDEVGSDAQTWNHYDVPGLKKALSSIKG